MIIFDQVTKKFPNGTVALDNISFHIPPQQFSFITGHSGAGKTTLLRLMLREFLPTKGKIRVNKTEVNQIKKGDLAHFRRQIGAAFQDFKILTDRTVFENIAVPLDLLSQTDSAIQKRVSQLLELTGLEGKADLFPSQVSGGELQRVVIARALAAQPKVLFADEPTGNLDPETAAGIIKLLEDINQLGTTVIIATHDQDLANKKDHRVIGLEKGKLVRDKEAKAKPKPKPKPEHKPKKD
jgi:cell division transport system ATP-binding protein